MSDASLFVLDSNDNPNIEIKFKDMFPVSLSGLDFDLSGGDSPYFVGSRLLNIGYILLVIFD